MRLRWFAAIPPGIPAPTTTPGSATSSGRSNHSVLPSGTAERIDPEIGPSARPRWMRKHFPSSSRPPRNGRTFNELAAAAFAGTACWGTNLRGEANDFSEASLISPAILLSGGNRATLKFSTTTTSCRAPKTSTSSKSAAFTSPPTTEPSGLRCANTAKPRPAGNRGSRPQCLPRQNRSTRLGLFAVVPGHHRASPAGSSTKSN